MTAILMAGISLCAEAGCENSNMTVHTVSGKPVKVYVDGETGANPPTKEVTVNGIPPGQHQLKVVAIYTDKYGRERRHTVFSGHIEVHPCRYMDARVEENRGVAIHETPLSEEPKPEGSAADKGEKPYTEDHNQEYKPQPVHESMKGNPHFNPTTADHYGIAAAVEPHTEDRNLPKPYEKVAPGHMTDEPVADSKHTNRSKDAMDESDFSKLKNTLSGIQYEGPRMDKLKTLASEEHFSTAQVSEIMDLFAFESDKLAVAKMLYDHTSDKKNYPRLAASFNFDARKKDFQKFLVGK